MAVGLNLLQEPPIGHRDRTKVGYIPQVQGEIFPCDLEMVISIN